MRSHWRRALPWIAPVLLALLAGLQILLVHTVHLTPWKGGGYGMFSTYDHGGFRTIRAFALDEAGERRLRIPGDLRHEVLRVLDLPSDKRVTLIARALARTAGTPVRVEVWRLEFDADLRPALHRLSVADSRP